MTYLSLDGCRYAYTFRCLQEIDLNALDGVDDKSSALPFLTKLLLNPFFARRKKVLDIVYKLERANDMVRLLQVKPIELHELATGHEAVTAADFESGSPRDRIKIVAFEYLRLNELSRSPPPGNGPNQQHSTKIQKSIIFDNYLYMDHLSLCLYALLNRTVNIPVINLLDLIETLLHIKHGPPLIIFLVLNCPHRCQEVCQSLITLGEGPDESVSLNEILDNRVSTLRAICQLNPTMIFKVRALSIQLRLVPSITIVLSLDQIGDARRGLDTSDDEAESKSSDDLLKINNELEASYESAITFMIGILQDEQEVTRTWFARYIKTAQQKRGDQIHDSILVDFRAQLVMTMRRLLSVLFEDNITGSLRDFKLDDTETEESFLNRKLIQATATLRYFSCLRGLGMLKLNQEESEALLSLIVCRLPKNETSVNFVTVAICTLFVCSSIINGHKEERRACDWLKWLVKEFGDDSICDLLNTILKHFQTNQINHISELICTTLGMRLQIKAFISKCKQLILHDVFNCKSSPVYPEQETEKRKSQAEYQVPIKDWIYKKIFEFDEKLRTELVGIRPKSISHDRMEDLKTRLLAYFPLDSSNVDQTLATVNKILKLPREDVWNFFDPSMNLYSQILLADWVGSERERLIVEKLIKAATKLWWQFNALQPRQLWIATINKLNMVPNKNGDRYLERTWDDIANDPLIVLKCCQLVFRNPGILNIMLHILSGSLEISKHSLQDQIDVIPDGCFENGRLDELKNTLVLAQTSAAIQILLEHCLPNELERKALDKRDYKKVDLTEEEAYLLKDYDKSVEVICQHLHQVFIADTNLAKLVHFQTYPSDLLAITTGKVPSMHICLDYIPELLSLPDLPKQVFVIQLTSHLCEKYAITKSLNCAKLCFNAAFTLLQLLPSDKRAMFYVPVLPALIRISKVFPILQEDTRLILNHVYQVTLAHMASTPSRLSLSAQNPFEGLDKLSWPEVKGLMRTLSLDESLFMCTQRCLLDLDQLELKDKQQQQTHDQSSLMIENSQRPAYNTIFAYGSHVMNPT